MAARNLLGWQEPNDAPNFLAAVAAGAVVILALVFGPMLLILAPLVALVGWARVELRDHTISQVIAGAAQGAVVAAVVFTLLRW